jgi:hypothetical protein
VPNRGQKLWNKFLAIDEIVELFFAALKKQRGLSSKLRKPHRQRLGKRRGLCAFARHRSCATRKMDRVVEVTLCQTKKIASVTP